MSLMAVEGLEATKTRRNQPGTSEKRLRDRSLQRLFLWEVPFARHLRRHAEPDAFRHIAGQVTCSGYTDDTYSHIINNTILHIL